MSNWRVNINFGAIFAFIICLICLASPDKNIKYIAIAGLIYACLK